MAHRRDVSLMADQSPSKTRPRLAMPPPIFSVCLSVIRCSLRHYVRFDVFVRLLIHRRFFFTHVGAEINDPHIAPVLDDIAPVLPGFHHVAIRPAVWVREREPATG